MKKALHFLHFLHPKIEPQRKKMEAPFEKMAPLNFTIVPPFI